MNNAYQSTFNSFESFFKNSGFEKIPAYNQFRRVDETGFDCTIFSFVRNSDVHTMEIHLGRRVNEVELFAQKYLHHLQDYSPHSMTMVSSLGRLLGQRYLRFDISNGLTDPIRKRVEFFLGNSAMVQFKNWSSLKYLNKLYNEDPYNMDVFYNVFNRAIRGIIINRFCIDSGYEELKSTYHTILHKHHMPKEKVEDFQTVTNYLDNYFPN